MDARRLFDDLRGRREAMADCLETLVRIESPSHDPASVGPVLAFFQRRLGGLGFRCRRGKGTSSGGTLMAVGEGQRGGPNQLVLGHADTVWPVGTLDRMPVRRQRGRLYGPGAYDMKGGLVQALFALEAIRLAGLRPSVRPIVFINSDEEIGSPDSAARINRLARVVERTFVVEPSLGPEGRLKTTRKGVGRFRIEVVGRAAHAGLDPEQGVSAIVELSHVVQSLFAMNDSGRGTNVNVGTVAGGTRPNVIAERAVAEVDVRVRTGEEGDRVERAIRGLRPVLKGTRLAVGGGFNRPPLEATPGNRRLWHRATVAAERLGIEIDEGAAGGGSDGNWASRHTATLDGLGAVGDGAHATHEHVVIERMPERAALLACLLLDPPGESQGANRGG